MLRCLILSLLLLLIVPIARAELAIHLTLGDDGTAYQEVAESFHAGVGSRASIKTWVLAELVPSELKSLSRTAVLMVPVGVKTARLVAENYAGIAHVLSLMAPRVVSGNLDWCNTPGVNKASTVFIDQPLMRTLNLLDAAFPQARTVGLMLSPDNDVITQTLVHESTRRKLVYNVEHVASSLEVAPALRRMLPESDLLLLLPDAMMINTGNAQNVCSLGMSAPNEAEIRHKLGGQYDYPWLRNLGIRERVLMLALLPLLLVATGLSWYFIASAYVEMDRTLEQSALDRADQLAKAVEFSLFSGNHADLELLAKPMVLESGIQSVSIVDSRGETVVKLGLETLARNWHANATGLVARSAEAILLVAPVMQRTLVIDDYDASQTSTQSDASLGYVTLQVSRRATLERQRKIVLAGVAITAIGLFLASLLAWRLARYIVRPIGELTQAVEKIAAGDLNARVQIGTGGEFAVLERGVNHMAMELKNSYDTLQEKIRAATAKLSWQAHHDALTGLLNRSGFDVALQQAWESARSAGEQHCLLYLDLDQFKLVNDTSGHQAGDELLRQLAASLRRTLRGSDVLARLGGDEFGVLLSDCDSDVGEQLGEKLRCLISDFRFSWNGRLYQVGVSIGLVELDQDWPDTAHLMSAADAACYAAKDAGRNRVRLYRRGDEEVERRRGEMVWVGRLTRAMQAGHFCLYYQPIVRLDPGGLDATQVAGETHFELLLRLHDEDFPVLPTAFIPAAERYQIMPAIDRWVIEQVLHQCADSLQALTLRNLVISINLSGVSLSNEQFQTFIRATMREHAAIAAQLCFEITETAAISNLASVQSLIDDLKVLGCRFSLDDFGSGLSSFAYLHNLGVDYLKIDGAFVRDMVRDPIDAAMVEAIAKVAHIMGIKTVAEFVEDAATASALRALGVDYGQGHHYAEARPLAELCEELAARVRAPI